MILPSAHVFCLRGKISIQKRLLFRLFVSPHVHFALLYYLEWQCWDE
jgi:hypothetical protein